MRRNRSLRSFTAPIGARRINLTPIEHHDALGYRSNISKDKILASLLTASCKPDWRIEVRVDENRPIKLSKQKNTEELIGVVFVPTPEIKSATDGKDVTITCIDTGAIMDIEVASITDMVIEAVVEDDIELRLNVKVTDNALIIEAHVPEDKGYIESNEEFVDMFTIFHEALRNEDPSKPSGFKVDIDTEFPFIRDYTPVTRNRSRGSSPRTPSTIAQLVRAGVAIYEHPDKTTVIYPAISQKTPSSIVSNIERNLNAK